MGVHRLAARLETLERQYAEPGRVVVVWGRPGPKILAKPGHVVLNVPTESEADPERGLDAEQRAAIRSDDLVVVVAYVDRSPSELEDWG